MSDEFNDPRELEELLPWYAAGTLSHAEAQRIEAALARDPELSNRFSIVREEMIGAIQVNESLGSPSERAMQQLFAKIDAEPARLRTKARSLPVRIAAFAASLSPSRLFAIAVAAAIVVVVQAAVIGVGLLHGNNGNYVAASAPAPTTAQGSFVLVRFAQGAIAANVTAFLESNQATIVNGPSGGGFYRLRVSQTKLTKGALSAIVQRMQRDRTVSFVVASE
jgi:anti-sigma factor RsiW